MSSVLSPMDIQRLADALAPLIADRLANTRRLVDRVELSNIIGLSVPTIERRMRDGSIPVVRSGRRTLFDVDAVVKAMSGGQQ